MKLLGEEIEKILSAHTVSEEDRWNRDMITEESRKLFPLDEKAVRKKLQSILHDATKEDHEKVATALEMLIGEAKIEYAKKETELSREMWIQAQKTFFLRTLDSLWMNHLDEIDYLRQGIGLRGYGQRDPLIEYKREAFSMFVVLIESIRTTYLSTVFRVMLSPPPTETLFPKNAEFHGADESVSSSLSSSSESSLDRRQKSPQKTFSTDTHIGRNDPCPCGAQKADGTPVKYKKCHGK